MISEWHFWEQPRKRRWSICDFLIQLFEQNRWHLELLDNPQAHEEIRKCFFFFSTLGNNFAERHPERVQLVSFWLLRASGGCVLLNISGATRLLERGYMTGRNGVIVERRLEEGDCCWWWTLAELWVNYMGESWLVPFTTHMYHNHIVDDFCLKYSASQRSLHILTDFNLKSYYCKFPFM